MPANDLIVFRKTEELLYRIYPRLVNYPKSLNVNKDKTKIFPINQGINAVGFKIYTTHRLLRNDSKKRIKRKVKKIRKLIEEEKMKPEKAEQIFSSWKGHAEHGNSYNFIQRLIEKNDYICINKKGVLKVDMSKINKGGECDAN